MGGYDKGEEWKVFGIDPDSHVSVYQVDIVTEDGAKFQVGIHYLFEQTAEVETQV